MTKIVNNINSICLLRLSAIGDVTHVLPVIATLKKARPNVKITWIIGKLEHKLMQGLPGVDFYVFDKSQGRKAYKQLKLKFKDTQFDVLLQMQYSFRANRAAWKINAKNRIGFDKKRSREFHGYRLTHRIASEDNQHVLDGFMEFLKPLGIAEKVLEWNLTVSKDDHEIANRIIDDKKVNVVISPCSSAIYRNWSNKKYAKIIDYLTEKYNANIILCGGPSEYEIQTSAEIESLAYSDVHNITGKDTLKQLFALLKIVDLVISPDSGPMHMANAAGTPVIGLHAATTAKRSGAYSYQYLAIDCFELAAEKYLNKSADQIRWGGQVDDKNTMDIITVDQVKEKINLALNNMVVS